MLETYTYGASRERLVTETSTHRTYYAWGGSAPVVEYTEATASSDPEYSRSYVYAGGRLLSTATNVSGTEIIEFHHPDRLGTRLVSNPGAGTYYQQSTLPFGTALGAEGTGFSNQVFTSYDRSASTGLDYAVNRTYSQGQSRFTQVDPIGMQAVDLHHPQTLNLYNYCGNDPINYIDSEGLSWIGKLFKGIGKVFSAIGKAINRVLSNIVVVVALTVLAAVVTMGMSLVASMSLFAPTITAPSWLAAASWVLTGASYASRIGVVLEISGTLFQGKFKRFAKIIGRAFVGALVGVIEDSIRKGFMEGFMRGRPFSGAWSGFKKGLGYVLDSFKRFGTRKWWEGFFPVYGYFCAPGWGIPGGSTSGERPVDKVDEACYKHDIDYENARGAPGERRLRTIADLKIIFRAATAPVRGRLVDRYFGSGYRVGDVYRTTLALGFTGWIGGRYLGLNR
ncbi:MAG TPA: RHS repeat-associated core domain-containing protein [Pyrinomonadaceae bacterium]|nr:RHS repeat-associated core domain-containing protein [Pyrinomonadaceae bacterium]HMP66776.1 RHS repeat-associated core domain-containing protein [Pyrinomonadaceae bacterium]